MNKQAVQIESAGEPPWYRQFWPWFLIALPAAAVIASFITLYLAITHPVHLVIDEGSYQHLTGEMKAQHRHATTIAKEPAGQAGKNAQSKPENGSSKKR